jgi:hypothetical protein
MPYDNEYNRYIAQELENANRNYAQNYAYSQVTSEGGHFKMGNASKRDGGDGVYNNTLELPADYYYGGPEPVVGGSGFASGTYRDTGFDSVRGVGGVAHYEKKEPESESDEEPEKEQKPVKPKRTRKVGGFKVGDLFTKDFWNNITISGGKKPKKPTKKDKDFLVGGFKLGDLGDKAFWDKITISGGAKPKKLTVAQKKQLVGGFKLGDLGNLDWWKNIVVSGGGMSGGTLLGAPDRVGMGRSGGKKLVDKEGTLLANSSAVLPNGVPPKAQLHSSSMSGQGRSGGKGCGRSGGKKAMPVSNDLVHIDFEKGSIPKGKGMSGGDGRKKRAEIVKRIMKEKGLKMIEASKYVKEHKLY